MVTATYTLDATKPTDVQLFYSPDKTEPRTWLPATTFPAQPGTNTHYWNCAASGATYGQFFFKLEVVEESSCCQPTTIDLAMIAVEGGEFRLGAAVQPDTDGQGGNGEVTNAHQVTLSNFCISETPVTQAQFEAVMGENPSNFKGFADSPNRPVERVSWYDAITFCNKLSLMEGKTPVYSVTGITDWGNYPYEDIPTSNNTTWNAATMDMSANGYRLPTEAEWEYAARGGQESETVQNGTLDFYYSGGNTVNVVAWYNGNSGNQTHIVKDKVPNALGLYDMSGNVVEWCWDWYDSYTNTPKENPTGATSGSYRVFRGGYWYGDAYFARVSSRSYNFPDFRSGGIGFRIACSSNEETCPEGSVMINGVCWATRNVDMPGTFAANPEDAGMFYQWNRNIGWSSTNPMFSSDGGNTWDSSNPPGTTWEPANDPSPPGYRVPTRAEIEALLDETKVTYTKAGALDIENGVPGRRFTDKDNGNSIFLPAAGYRAGVGGTLYYVDANGNYWSSTQAGTLSAYLLNFGGSDAYWVNGSRSGGVSVRPVAE